MRAGGWGAAPSPSWSLSLKWWLQAVTQGPSCLFPPVSQPVKPVMSGLVEISRMAAWHLPFPVRMGKFLEHQARATYCPGPCQASPAPCPGSSILPQCWPPWCHSHPAWVMLGWWQESRAASVSGRRALSHTRAWWCGEKPAASLLGGLGSWTG